MSENFEAGLRGLHDGAARAHAAGSGLPIPALVGRARRNRRIRVAAASAVATAVVVGVAWAGSAVAGLGDAGPVQPAETTQPDPTMEPTWPTETVLTCGAVIADLSTLDEAPVIIEATIEVPTLPATEPLTATIVMAAVDPPGPTITDEVVLGLRYLVVRDGVVVGIGRDNGDAPVVSLSGRDGVAHEAEITVGGCDEDGLTTIQFLAAGDYELYGGLVVQIAGRPGDEGLSEGVLLGGPWPFTVQEVGWSPIDIAEVPVDVPGAEERMIRTESHADGLRWRVTVEFDECRDMYGRAREALIAAGLAVVSEESDPQRPLWSRGVFRDDHYDVELETSNETGGGCFGDYLITAH